MRYGKDRRRKEMRQQLRGNAEGEQGSVAGQGLAGDAVPRDSEGGGKEKYSGSPEVSLPPGGGRER